MLMNCEPGLEGAVSPNHVEHSRVVLEKSDTKLWIPGVGKWVRTIDNSQHNSTCLGFTSQMSL